MKKNYLITMIISILLIVLSGCETITAFFNDTEVKLNNANSNRLIRRLENDEWDVDKIDTARNADYLSESEKDVILISNAVRTNPAKFGELYVKPITKRFDGLIMSEPNGTLIQTNEGVKVVNELYNQLLNENSFDIFLPSKGLSQAAKDHALDQSKTGGLGHTGSDGSQPFDRMNKYGNWDGYAGENISYGRNDGLGIILQLLIDDGVPSRGHRVNILNPNFNIVGVGIDKHSQYGYVCVIDYASIFNESS